MKQIVLSTRNLHKVKEIVKILEGLPFEIVPVDRCPDVPEVEEDGTTLEENAVKKASTVARATGSWAMADDTGLEVDFLAGEPGVYSARWAGPGCTYEDNNRKLLEKLAGVPRERRSARFRCVIALSSPEGKTYTVAGCIEGVITESPRGEHGFGYDPVFDVPEYGKTFSELESSIKNTVSHRARALHKARKLLDELMEASLI